MIARYLALPCLRWCGGDGWSSSNRLFTNFDDARAFARSVCYDGDGWDYDWVQIVDLTIPAVVWTTTPHRRDNDKITFEEVGQGIANNH